MRHHAWLCGAIGVVSLTACVTTLPWQGASSLTLDNGATVVTAGRPPEAMGAVQYSGQVVLLEQGCWGFKGFDSTNVLMLPSGSKASGDGTGVVTPDGVTVRVGDQILAGGYGAGDGTALDAEWRAVAPECFESRRGSALVDIERDPDERS